MASSSSSSSRNLSKYEVFISFRGFDVRDGFLSHLYSALISEQIDAFIDNELERGKDITENLLQIIEGSALSIVIFSQDYPGSEWCLEELEKIHESMEQRNQTVVPVFYKVDPSDVQHLKANYAIQKPEWRDALVEISNLSGFDSGNFKDDAKLIDDIVADVRKKLSEGCPAISNDDGLFGIDSSVNDVKSLLRLDSTNDVRMVGIWGMGGIGKTTLALKVFHEIKNNFDGHCFVKNVRETLSKDGETKLSNEIIQKLLEDRNISTGSAISVGDSIQRRLKRRKVFLVLDDVHTCMQLNSLLESCGLQSRDSFCPGSRIIVTSRDSQVLRIMNLESSIYKAKQLKDDEALRLLCWRAFGKNQPQQGYTEISKELVRYSHGVPLALAVLGSELKHKDLRFWEVMLKKVTCISPQEIQKILRISFDGLDREEKDIFLDIACFFKGYSRKLLENMLERFGFHASIGIDRLIDKSLLKDDYGRITMHDLVEQMGHEIVAEEKESKGQQSRLWKYDDVKNALTNNTGTENVEAIQLLYIEDEIDIISEAFSRMHKLRYLCLQNWKINCREGIRFLPNSIMYLNWYKYPLSYLPSNYSADNLVELEMYSSKLEEINWTKPLRNLKRIFLCFSTNLVRISDLSLAPNLEVLDLTYCENLVEFGGSRLGRSPSTIGRLTHLKQLFLGWCERLESLPSSISRLSSLEEISLHGCINIVELPEDFGNLESLTVLDASYSGLRALPQSIRNLKNLIKLNLEGCKELRFIPALPSNLQGLFASNCKSLTNPVSSSVVNQYFWKACNQPTKVHHLQITGSEMPEWMMYRNDCGSSVSLDLQTPGPSTTFIFCVVAWEEFFCGNLEAILKISETECCRGHFESWRDVYYEPAEKEYSFAIPIPKAILKISETECCRVHFESWRDVYYEPAKKEYSFAIPIPEAILKISETECCHGHFNNESWRDVYYEPAEKEYNVFLWKCDFDCKFVKEVLFQTDCKQRKIIKCGVHPIVP